MTQATTVMPRAAGMSETVLTPTTRRFLQKFAKNSSKQQNFVKKYKEKERKSPFLFDSFQLVR
jgi:molybdenum-dependent DNA-binding transcriptional regulator ModE